MAVEVLQNRKQIIAARRIMESRGFSCLSPLPLRWCKRFGITTPNPVVGDFIKSWDVLRSIELIEKLQAPQGAVLDMGAFCSETLPALRRLGFRNLTGIDFNPQIGKMPHADEIHYLQGDFLASGLPDSSINAAVAISAIEHGYDAKRLFSEVSRLLKPGGVFAASFDYWPDKISTAGIELFGLDWRIFSRDEVLELIDRAHDHGLVPVGELNLDASESPIHFAGKRYTFGWLALSKGCLDRS